MFLSFGAGCNSSINVVHQSQSVEEAQADTNIKSRRSNIKACTDLCQQETVILFSWKNKNKETWMDKFNTMISRSLPHTVWRWSSLALKWLVEIVSPISIYYFKVDRNYCKFHEILGHPAFYIIKSGKKIDTRFGLGWGEGELNKDKRLSTSSTEGFSKKDIRFLAWFFLERCLTEIFMNRGGISAISHWLASFT